LPLLGDEASGTGTHDAGTRLEQAIEQLREKDPAVRRRAMRLINERGEESVVFLIRALKHDYLGVRIGAYEGLKELAPDVPEYEPWSAKDDREQQADAIEKWWSGLGRLERRTVERTLTPVEQRTIDDAIGNVFLATPVRRTRAMTTLVDMGPAALPDVRGAIERAEREDNQDAVLLFEDVRWAILVPDRAETAHSVRHDLARGTSEKRQAAVQRLGSTGADALPPLRELIDDGDSLVRESAIHALSKVGGRDALAATATMLDAHDPNLRMIAAQELGASGSPDAGQHLVKAIDDPDEVVAIAAIAAMEQAKAEKHTSALIRALDDPRWRVRAASAETLGKMQVKQAQTKLEALLEDNDAFVVRSALTGLKEMDAKPNLDKVIALASRHESMRQIVVEYLLEEGGAVAQGRLVSLYREAAEPLKANILTSLAGHRSNQRDDDAPLRPLFNEAIGSQNPTLRRLAVTALRVRAYPLAIEYADKVLADSDDDVRREAAELIIPLVAFHYALTDQGQDLAGYGVLTEAPARSSNALSNTLVAQAVSETDLLTSVDDAVRVEAEEDDGAAAQASRAQEQTKQAPTNPQGAEVIGKHQAWHRLLTEHPPADPASAYHFARFITADAEQRTALLSDLSDVQVFFDQDDKVAPSVVARLLVELTPMPGGLDLMLELIDRPDVYALFLQSKGHMNRELQAALFDPQRLVQAIETAADREGEDLIEVVVGGYDRPGILQVMSVKDAEHFMQQLLNSTQPLPRALGLFLTTTHEGLPADARIIPALADADPWVRRAAVQAFLKLEKTSDQIEATVGPMIADTSAEVGAVAAAGVLLTPLREAAELPPADYEFQYGSISVSRSWSSVSQTRPPQIIDRQPPFLPALRELASKPARDESTADIIALTLAQYGDFSALDHRLEAWQSGPRQQVPDVLLVGLALTRDERYLEPLRVRMQQVDSSYEMRELLKWLRGTNSDQARALRREINQRLRELDR
jgi:HEAT repeat protein